MKLLLAFGLSALCLCTNAQKKLPSFGKIDSDDLRMTECSFDKGADAIKLIDQGSVEYQRGTYGHSNFITVYNKRTRIKILKDKGLSYANVELPFYNRNNEEKIFDVDAVVYNLDEKGKVVTTKVNKSSFYTKRINKHFSRFIMALPNVKVGSVIEYRYKKERDSETYLQDWYFQDEIPTAYSEYVLEIPAVYRFSHQPLIAGDFQHKESLTDVVINIGNSPILFKAQKSVYAVENRPGISTEPYMSTAKDYLQRVSFKLSQVDNGNNVFTNVSTSWLDIVKRFSEDEDFGVLLKKNYNSADSVWQNALKIPGETERLQYVFNAVRKHMVNIDDEAIYMSDPLEKTWREKKGNIADINMHLVTLLKLSGLDASPVLLSTRDHGVVIPEYPDLRQFNVLMAFIRIGTKTYVLDGTDKVSDYKLTPERIVNTRGLVLADKNPRMEEIINNDHKYRMQVSIKAHLTSDGFIIGEGNVISYDYARKQRVEEFLKDPVLFKKNFFLDESPGIIISEITTKNEHIDSLPFIQNITFSSPLAATGDYSYFSTNYFTEFNRNPFVEQNRKTDVDFGFQQEYVVYLNYTLPDGYTFDEIPKDAYMTMPGRKARFSRMMEAKNNVLNSKIVVEFNAPYYEAGAYPQFHTFYKQVIESLNEQVVIKKKS